MESSMFRNLLETLTVTPAAGSPVTFLAGGRSIDQDGDGIIGQREGENAAAPNTIIGNRDAYLQTTADWMQLVRAIQVGMDVDGDGAPARRVEIAPEKFFQRGRRVKVRDTPRAALRMANVVKPEHFAVGGV
jgi:hypothetical protein